MAEREDRADVRHLQSALCGDQAAMRRLVKQFTPVIQARVARYLVCHGRRESRRNLQEEIADLTQEIFSKLFSSDAKTLRSWRSGAGLSLNNFVGMVAERQTISILRPRHRSPWVEDPTEDIDTMLLMTDDPEALVATREILAQVLEQLRAELSPLGQKLLQQLILDEEDISDIVASSGMTPGALYMWRNRLVKSIRQKAAVLMLEPASPGRTPSVEET